MFDILKSVVQKNSHGHDGISGVSFSSFSVVLSEFLANAFKQSVQPGNFLSLLKQQTFFLSSKKEQRITLKITVQLVYYHPWENVMKN